MLALDPRVVAPMWETVESLIPPVVDTHPLGCHRPRVPDRDCFLGILSRLVTGSSWATAAVLVGVGETTLRRRRDEWLRAGVFHRVVELALCAYDRVVGLRLEEIAIDGSQHKAPMGGSGTGPSHLDRGKCGWKWSIATEAAGIPVGWIVAPANVHDQKLVEDTLDAIDGHGLELEIEQAHLDRGYDAAAVRAIFSDSGIEAHIPHRAPRHSLRRPDGSSRKNKIPLGRRWKVERANSWLSNFGQLRRSTDRKAIHREANMDLAVALLLTVKLVKWKHRYGAVIPIRP
jgi:transposase